MARSFAHVYPFWRDLGYAVGRCPPLIADAFGLAAAIASIAVLAFVSGVIVMVAMAETRAQ